MPYDLTLADRIREYLVKFPKLKIVEKEMFRGLTFMVNGKMCVCVSGDNLMCRFDPELTGEVSERNGFMPMQMKGRVYKGFCYIEPAGFKAKNDFESWVNLCLDFNARAKASKKTKSVKSSKKTASPKVVKKTKPVKAVKKSKQARASATKQKASRRS